jgi:hypothetical protein
MASVLASSSMERSAPSMSSAPTTPIASTAARAGGYVAKADDQVVNCVFHHPVSGARDMRDKPIEKRNDNLSSSRGIPMEEETIIIYGPLDDGAWRIKKIRGNRTSMLDEVFSNSGDAIVHATEMYPTADLQLVNLAGDIGGKGPAKPADSR